MNTSAALGSNATFQCTVRNAGIKWRVHGEDIDWTENIWNENGIYEGETLSSGSNSTSRLLVLASNNNAEFSFACVASGEPGQGEAIDSHKVYLSVFGMF